MRAENGGEKRGETAKTLGFHMDELLGGDLVRKAGRSSA